MAVWAVLYKCLKLNVRLDTQSALIVEYCTLRVIVIHTSHYVYFQSGCKRFCHLYRILDIQEKLRLLCHIAENYGADQDAIVSVARKVVDFQVLGPYFPEQHLMFYHRLLVCSIMYSVLNKSIPTLFQATF